MKRLILLLSVFVLAATASAADPVSPAGKEYIVASGGPSLMLWEKWKAQPHDLWWQNFIRAAEIRIMELKSQGVPANQITWFVYRPGYETRAKQEGLDLIGNINSRGAALGVKLKFFRKADEFTGYLNAGRPRQEIKIANLEYFGHSNKACWMFDYSNLVDSASKIWIHENEFNRLAPGIFARDAYVKSWGCHTGESMSQKFRKTAGLKMWGAVGRTQYNTHELPSLAQPSGKWKY